MYNELKQIIWNTMRANKLDHYVVKDVTDNSITITSNTEQGEVLVTVSYTERQIP